MKPSNKTSIEVRGNVVNIIIQNDSDYICLTDIARFKDPERTDYLISNWMRRLVAKSPSAKGRFLGFGLCRWRGRFAAFPANE
jgi:hypothetical protein